MIQKTNQFHSAKRYPRKAAGSARPFWLPASSFYVLGAAVTIAVFFLVWAVLREEGEDIPWITAGLAASVVLGGAVFLREIVFRRARNRLLETQKRLDRSLKGVSLQSGGIDRPDKLTLESNATILREIRQKSEAARVLGNMASGHKEVFELCGRYLSINSRELAYVGAGSPRLAALLKGKELAEEFHRHHLLQWAEIEARALSNEARSSTKVTVKIAAAQKALSVVDAALQHYPDERNLKASGDAINEFLVSVKLSNWIERAERAAFRGNHKQARKLYNDALFFLDRENVPADGHELAASRINEGLQRVSQLES